MSKTPGAVYVSDFLESLEIQRKTLLERLERVRPKLIALIAPAGFGKSTLVRQFLAGKAGAAICDCAGVRDDLDLARRLVPALAAERPEREGALTPLEIALGDGGATIADRVNRALEAWAEPSGGVIVFEHAECISRSPAAREFFYRLLSRRPDGRTLMVCSRESLRFHLTRFAAPHEIMVLRAADLSFDRDDLDVIFAPYDLGSQTVDRIFNVSQGWPIAVLLLKRFAAEGRIATLLQRLDDVAFDELQDYLADEVIASLDPRLIAALFACACFSEATLSDLRIALDDSAVIEELAEYAKQSPFVERSRNGRFAVHPMLASLLLEYREEDRTQLVRRVAERHESTRAYVRAAELYLSIDDAESAARALGTHEVLRDPSPSLAYAKLIAMLDRGLVSRYPRLWGVTALMRLFTGDTAALLEEADSLWSTTPAGTSSLERYYIFAFRAIALAYLGRFEEASKLIDDFAAQAAQAGDDAPLGPYLRYLCALVAARTGRLNEAERELTAALPTLDTMDVLASGALMLLGADVARVRGERSAERQFIARALERSRAAGLPSFIAFDLAEAAFGSWLAGEEASFESLASELDSIVEQHGVSAFAYFASSARGRVGQPAPAELDKYVAAGRLMATANASEAETAHRLARAAMAAADRCRQPYMQCLAALAVLFTDQDGTAQEYGGLALEYAMQCESPNLHAAVRAAVQHRDDCGMLTRFVQRLTKDRVEAPKVLEVSVTSGTVSVEGRSRSLAGRELELLVALALRRETVTRARLCEMLWPDVDEAAARNALSVCLHRLRAHLGREDCIVRDGEGYRLNDYARVDVCDIERSVSGVFSRNALRDADRMTLRNAYEKLRAERPSRMARWEWFAQTERRLNELRLEVSSRLANDALERREFNEALSYATSMIAYDPYDEPAREIAMRAYLQSGDRAAAVRMYRQYRDTLLSELDCEPSPALAALLNP